MARLTPEDVPHLRAQCEPLPSGIAPFVSSDFFKSAHAKSKPSSKSMNHHLSNEAQCYSGSSLKKSAALDGNRKIIRMGVGRPYADLYPWHTISLGLSAPAQSIASLESISLDQEKKPTLDVATALNYSNAMGSPALIRFLTEHAEIVHDPPYSDWNVCVTCGTTSSMNIALRAFCDPGDSVLAEEFTYPGFLEAARLTGVKVHGVSMDSEGLCSDDLDSVLRNWDESSGPKPKVLYTIPSGQNPTGYTQSTQRRQAIFEIAEKHDLIILEDDPYYFLDLESSSSGSGAGGTPADSNSSFLPSYLSIDRSGRVIRFDSPSKTLSPGLRVGWVTASSQIIDKFIAYNETDAVAASGPAQFMLCNLLEDSWGHRGFFAWLADLSSIYRRRRDVMEHALRKYLPSGLCRWDAPRHGMFLWLRLDIARHPMFQFRNERQKVASVSALDIEERISAAALEAGVQVTKGSLFAVDRRSRTEVTLRITFAAAAETDLEEGVRILAYCIRKEFGIEEFHE